MPEWLQVLVGNNPVTHLAAASRALMHGEPAFDHVIAVLIACAVLTGVFAPLAMWMYHREK